MSTNLRIYYSPTMSGRYTVEPSANSCVQPVRSAADWPYVFIISSFCSPVLLVAPPFKRDNVKLDGFFVVEALITRRFFRRKTILVGALGSLTSYLLARLPWFAPFVGFDRNSLRPPWWRFARFTWFISHDFTSKNQQVEPTPLKTPTAFAGYQRIVGIRRSFKELPSASTNMVLGGLLVHRH